jgi:conjugal transfer pilus assembly protein TrbC
LIDIWEMDMKRFFKDFLISWLVLMLFMVTVVVTAKEVNEVSISDVDKAQQRAKDTLDQISPVQPDVADMHRVPNIPGVAEQGMQIHTANAQDPFVVAERVRQTAPNMVFDPADAEDADLLVFVSFSMPQASLNRIAAETAKVGGVLVLRGFVEDSLKKTVAASEKMTNLGAQLQIHPDMFTQFNVQRVPTYVITKKTEAISSCDKGTQCVNHVKLEGDAGLRTVLDRMSQSGDRQISKIAGAKLAKLDGVQP